MKIPDAISVYFPKPSTARLKIPPHITEVHSPHRIKNIILIGTETKPKEMSDLNTGMLTFIPSGTKIASVTKIKPNEEATINITFEEILPPIEAPTNRPISIKNQ